MAHPDPFTDGYVSGFRAARDLQFARDLHRVCDMAERYMAGTGCGIYGPEDFAQLERVRLSVPPTPEHPVATQQKNPPTPHAGAEYAQFRDSPDAQVYLARWAEELEVRVNSIEERLQAMAERLEQVEARRTTTH